MQAFLEIHKIIHSSGHVDTSGKINEIVLQGNFKNFDPKNPKPFVNMIISSIDYNPSDFHISIHMSWIPSFIADLIIKIFKSKILHSIIPKIVESVNK